MVAEIFQFSMLRSSSDQWLLSYNPFARRLGGLVELQPHILEPQPHIGWLVKSDYITTPSAILYDGSFLWAECGNIKQFSSQYI